MKFPRILLSLVLLAATSLSAASRPNVVFILADDLGYRDIGCYGGPVKTPVLDKLAAGGVRFTDFHSGAPGCSPSRASFLTGRHHYRAGVYSVISERLHRMHLLESETTIAEVLKENGYATAHFGKWHLGMPVQNRKNPTPADHGFDYWFGLVNGPGSSHKNPTQFLRNGKRVGQIKGYSCQIVVDEALTWLDEKRDAKEPFFLNLWFNEPHAPIAAPDEIVSQYGDLNDQAAIYSGTIDNTDRAIGRLVARLKKLGELDNTIIVYSSDNGSYRQERNGELRGKKGSQFEGGHRVPGIFYWKGGIPGGRVEDEPAAAVDLLPTLCGLIGIKKPAKVHLDGSDLAPLLTRSDTFERHQPLFWISGANMVVRIGDHTLFASGTARSPIDSKTAKRLMEQIRGILGDDLEKGLDDKKLRDRLFSQNMKIANPEANRLRHQLRDLYYFNEAWIPELKKSQLGRVQLYDLSKDLGQQKDIAKESPEIVARMKKQAAAIYASVMAEAPEWLAPEEQAAAKKPKETILDRPAAGASDKPPNVLFIAVDDLNDWVGCLGGHPQAKTPNIDRLASRGVLFEQAYCSAPLCNPSRMATMTGLRSSTIDIWSNEGRYGKAGTYSWFRDKPEFKDWVTIPQYFRQHGYTAVTGGKIFHQAHGKFSDPVSWDHQYSTKTGTPFPRNGRLLHGMSDKMAHEYFQDWADWQALDIPEKETADWKTAEGAAAFLQRDHDKPFFLGCGIFRPHLRWYAPQKYFDMHPLENIELPATLENDLDDVPPIGRRQNSGGSQAFGVIREHAEWKKAVQGYLASCSFADACVGVVLDALEESDYAENTIVVLWGDHGFHVGQKDRISKLTLWEQGSKTPLIISAPDLAATQGKRCKQPVSLVDLYPTLIELVGLPARDGLDGRSIAPLLRKPETQWEYPAVISLRDDHAVRSQRWHYIRYADGSEELYDNFGDPYQWDNLANHAQFADAKTQLKKWLPKNKAERSGSNATRSKTSQKSRQSKDKQPNVVILLADDLGSKDLGCYGGPVKTPVLDGLAAKGVRFTDFHAGAAVCSPSRATLLTGRQNLRTGIYGVLQDHMHDMHLLEREVTIAEVLKKAGYGTAHFGKWHIGMTSGKRKKPSLQDHGFDYWFGLSNGANPSHRNPTNFMRNGKPVGPMKGYSCQIVVSDAINWLETKANPDQPFFMNIWFNEPHSKLAAPDEITSIYGDLKDEGALYSATVDNTDRAIGRLVAKLKETGKLDNTLIIYSSDHGSYRTDRNGGLKGNKGSNFQGGLRSPGIFFWPNGFRGNRIEGTPSGAVDLLPTICGLAGIDKPKGVHLDGADLSPLLIEKGTFKRSQPMLWLAPSSGHLATLREGNYTLMGSRGYKLPSNQARKNELLRQMARLAGIDPSTPNLGSRVSNTTFTSPEYKRLKSEFVRLRTFQEAWIPTIKAGGFRGFALYDLKADPLQKKDISKQRPKVTERLKKKLLELYKDVLNDAPDWPSK